MPIIAAVLSACDPVSERDCGIFDHPELALWQGDGAIERALFVSSSGASIDFARQAVVFNEPFLGSDGASNDEDVVCELTATVRLQTADGSLAIDTIFIQRERFLLESSDESLFIEHSVEVPAGTVAPGSFLADISVSATRLNLAPTRIEYLEADVETVEIGGQSYADVVRISSTHSVQSESVEAVTGAISEIREIVIARNFGLVAFTDDLNREFVRVPIE